MRHLFSAAAFLALGISHSRFLRRPRQRKTGAAISTILTTHVSHARRREASDLRITARIAARMPNKIVTTRKAARNPVRDGKVASREAQVSTKAIHIERIRCPTNKCSHFELRSRRK